MDKLLETSNKSFPLSTVIINILGSFLIGVLYNLSAEKLSPEISKALIIGFCGGFTTFSSFSYQLIMTYQNDQLWKAALYFFLSVGIAPLACVLGIKLIK